MAGIVVENKICKKCGADVRPLALFCYNCGSAVADDSIETKNETKNETKKEAKNGNEDRNTVLERDNKKPEASEKTIIIETNKEKSEFTAPKVTEFKEEKKDIIKEAKLKSAASLRDKAKSFQKKEIEVIWEEPQRGTNVLLLIAALILTAFAAAVVVLAIYLK